MITLYHNPHCSKSRQTLALLQAQGITPHIILYLSAPPDTATLKTLLTQLGMSSARQLMRQQEALYHSLTLADHALSEMQLLQAMAENPQLIERPIVVANGKARIGRPPERVMEIIRL